MGKRLTSSDKNRIFNYSKNHTDQETAKYFDVSISTVQRYKDKSKVDKKEAIFEKEKESSLKTEEKIAFYKRRLNEMDVTKDTYNKYMEIQKYKNDRQKYASELEKLYNLNFSRKIVLGGKEKEDGFKKAKETIDFNMKLAPEEFRKINKDVRSIESKYNPNLDEIEINLKGSKFGAEHEYDFSYIDDGGEVFTREDLTQKTDDKTSLQITAIRSDLDNERRGFVLTKDEKGKVVSKVDLD